MQPRTLQPHQILKWLEQGAGVARIRSDRDLVPDGYLAAMLPMFVDWRQTSANFDDDNAHAVLRLVRHGGNPLERTTVFHSMRVSVNRVEAVEFTLVPYGQLATGTPLQHAQIRFMFERGHEPELSDFGSHDAGSDSTVPDLVLGWGGWRRFDEDFSLIKALDGSKFNLSLRAHTGPQCFLEDTLKGRDWISYRLRMPGGAQGANELLQVMLAMGDGVARQTLARILRQGEQSWLDNIPASTDSDVSGARQWEDIQQRLRQSSAPQDAPAIPESEQSYHALARSCVMLARYSVLVAAARMVSRGHTDGVNMSRLPAASLGATEDWMTEAAETDLLGIFVRAPLALRYVVQHPESMPDTLIDELESAGLLARQGGKRVETRYGRSARRPYSSTGLSR